jgi:membrane peptidoglycan carboxypeptidase
MTECYGAFAADGVLTAARSYILIKDSSGKTIIKNEKEQKRIYKQSTARIMNQLLSCVVKDGTAKSITLKNSRMPTRNSILCLEIWMEHRKNETVFCHHQSDT